MLYYAKTNTAHPKVGFITKGEVLTGEQAARLGDELLKRMTENGVLGMMIESESTEPVTLEMVIPEVAIPEEVIPKASEEAGEDGGEDLPELDGMDDIEPAKPAKATKTRKGRK